MSPGGWFDFRCVVVVVRRGGSEMAGPCSTELEGGHSPRFQGFSQVGLTVGGMIGCCVFMNTFWLLPTFNQSLTLPVWALELNFTDGN